MIVSLKNCRLLSINKLLINIYIYIYKIKYKVKTVYTFTKIKKQINHLR